MTVLKCGKLSKAEAVQLGETIKEVCEEGYRYNNNDNISNKNNKNSFI